MLIIVPVPQFIVTYCMHQLRVIPYMKCAWTRDFVGAIKGKERLITKVNTSIGDMHAAITLIPALPAHN